MALTHDLRFSARSLARNSGLSLVVISILALGIGAAVAVLDTTNLLAWRPMPAEAPDRLARIFTGNLRGFSGPWGFTADADYLAYSRDATVFLDLAAHRDVVLRVDTGTGTQERSVGAVSSSYFTTLRLRPDRGRFFTEDEHRVGAGPAAILSHHLWLQAGGSDGAPLLGTQIRVEGVLFTVVGVAPESFPGDLAGEVLDLFVPLETLPRVESNGGLLTDRAEQRFYLTGRLAPDRTHDEAQTQIATIAARLDSDFPLSSEQRRDVRVIEARFVHPIDLQRISPSLKLFAAAAALLLLITCANVAHLLLARAEGRRRELALRQSLGAGQLDLARQLLIEAALLAGAGGLGGLLLAYWARIYLATFASPAYADAMRFDLRVLGGTVAVCGFATLLFGLAPAVAGAKTDVRGALASAATGAGGGRRRASGWLAATQAALAVLLLSGGALLGLSLLHRLDADLGFDDQHLVMAALTLPEADYSPQEGRLLFEGLYTQAEALPGVERAATALFVPPMLFDITIPFRTPQEATAERKTRLNYVGPSYFDTLGLQLERGRLFSDIDAPGSASVVVVNRAFADAVWPDQDPLGRRLIVESARPEDAGPDFTVVGVVSNIDQFRASFGGEPVLYFPTAQKYRGRQQLVLRTREDPAVVFEALRRLVRSADPGLALTDLRTGPENRRNAFTFEHMQTVAVAAFAGAGLLLAVVGLAAVLSYRVSRSVRAIGIRMAVGARRVDIRCQVVADGLRWTGFGASVGALAVLLLAPTFGDLLFGIDTAAAMVVVAGVLAVALATAAVAADIPARRASRLDPLDALRHD
ncbi:MAG: ADOP family duplicated permease [Acidobacteriota bacterium]